MVSFEGAREFIHREARLLERRLFGTLFEGAPPDGVATAVAAYANDDGGLGHALEPDVRCPESQPLFVAFGLDALAAAGAAPAELLGRCCAFLEAVADDRGAVPMLLPSFQDYAHAAHWTQSACEPVLHPALWTAASLHELGFEHPWRDRATAFALDELDRDPPRDAHALREAFRLLAALADRDRLRRLAAVLPRAEWLRTDPASTDYGVTPLQLAPTPELAGELFPQEVLNSHLDALEAEQQADGGWELSWEPPSAASRLEWRGVRTIEALRLLRAFGRLEP